MRAVEFLPVLLNEIKMTPSNLQKIASTIDAKVGMEFEMIVPISNYVEYEPDWDYNETITSIDDAVTFFDDMNRNSRSDIRRLYDAMNDQYQIWLDDKMDDLWSSDGRDFVEGQIEFYQHFDRDERREDIEAEIRQDNPDLSNVEIDDLVNDRLEQEFEQYVDRVWDREEDTEVYDEAKQEHYDQNIQDLGELEWLNDEGIDTAKDVYEEHSDLVEWPYEKESMDFRELADDFSEYVNFPIKASTTYHGIPASEVEYKAEIDTSIEPDREGETGVEFVSPPLDVGTAIQHLLQVREWASRVGASTNESTGLHINVSVPNLKYLDYVKLALLLGDEYVLQQFQRQTNTYAKSVVERFRLAAESDQQNIKSENILGMIKKESGIHAAHTILRQYAGGKYVSINDRGNYIEFRGPGGDWLGQSFDVIVPTMMRAIVALDAACDPEKYRKEYQKKLYKILTQSFSQHYDAAQDLSTILSLYFAGEDRPEVKQRAVEMARQLIQSRRQERAAQAQKEKHGMPMRRWKITQPNGDVWTYAGTDAEDAKQRLAKALEDNGRPVENFDQWRAEQVNASI